MLRYTLILGLVIALPSYSGAEPAKLIKELDNVSGALFARSVKDAPVLLVFSPVTEAEGVLGKRKPLRDPDAEVRFPQPSDLPEGVGEGLPWAARAELARLFKGGGHFAGKGPCREFRAFRFLGEKAEQTFGGVSCAIIDYSVPVPRKVYPDTLPPCSAVVQLSGREPEGRQFVACIPGVWPQGLSKDDRASLPEFTRLTNSECEKWGKDKSFLVFEMLAGNPFALRPGESNSVVAMQEVGADRIVIFTSSGERVEFNNRTDKWTTPFRLADQRVISVVPMGKGHMLFWQNNHGGLVSGISEGLERLAESREEGVSLKGKSNYCLTSDGEVLWMAALEETGGMKSLVVCGKSKPDSGWSVWHELARFPSRAKLTMDMQVLRQEGKQGLIIAVTDSDEKKARVYYWSLEREQSR